MQMNRLPKQLARMVRSRSRRTGMIGCAALLSHHTNPMKQATESGRVVNGMGWVHGTSVPPVFSPSSSRTKNEHVKKAPR
ncbi:hypothetical protein IF2G_01332 [Cordyceps javanica]|nr:hypothetical protein IF2G_01332 [Cordyceps javanica]